MSEPWQPPPDWRRITTIDAHAAGEPLRLIVSGFPVPSGTTALEQRRFAAEHFDHLRRSLMWEPRGHADMYGCLLTPPTTPDGDLGILFMHNDGFSTMCGHGVIGAVTVGIECGLVSVGSSTPTLRLDTPVGRVVATARVIGSRVESVSFVNVPSFVLAFDVDTAIPGLGVVRCDVAFGGAFYAYVDAAQLGLDLEPASSAQLTELGMQIKRRVSETCTIAHPDSPADLNFLYGTIFVGSSAGGAHSRHVCIFANGELDRSPTGTGVCGRAAILHARGQLKTGDAIEIESVVGTRFGVRVIETTSVGGHRAVIPEVTGRAWITGRHEFLIDPGDPLGDGFLVR
ncbi:MAG TPA: proline racemase family protein [Gemmatimonadales bacterium]|nr:proline racemase family protein [Gemmatimonadales bacterium]